MSAFSLPWMYQRVFWIGEVFFGLFSEEESEGFFYFTHLNDLNGRVGNEFLLSRIIRSDDALES